ncbi:hypothetical protein NDU88_002756 [Pleurodeles waltl]|uniref:Reverse transcriptase domain-containing protein n=1 Tax=Pleurodeles waltl TaxID=8319 RepID=A0AAV7SFU3_PLEWA|nr:hypothetical protein NDU88_002756 [Pleurodeles waltl]
MIKTAGRGALLAKADIESAFRLLPVHPDSYHLLGFQHNGQVFMDKAMPMGRDNTTCLSMPQIGNVT